MNCQEQQMTQQMWDAMPEGMTVNYSRWNGVYDRRRYRICFQRCYPPLGR
jgi:hypothetical protein